MEQQRKHRIQIGIKWKMFAILVMFVALVALSIWIFQIQMLNYFYQNAKFKEFEVTSNNIIKILNYVIRGLFKI